MHVYITDCMSMLAIVTHGRARVQRDSKREQINSSIQTKRL